MGQILQSQKLAEKSLNKQAAMNITNKLIAKSDSETNPSQERFAQKCYS